MDSSGQPVGTDDEVAERMQQLFLAELTGRGDVVSETTHLDQRLSKRLHLEAVRGWGVCVS